MARLHLTKLAEINLITADFLKSGKGGRPGRIYKVSEQGVDLSFPKREDKHLIKWAIELVYEFGQEGLEKAKKISYEDGYSEMRSRLVKMNSPINFEDRVEMLSEAALLVGYIPKIVDTEKGKKSF